MCFVCLQRSESRKSYDRIYGKTHTDRDKTHRDGHCECVNCSFDNETGKTEHSLLLYLCDSLDVMKVEDLSRICEMVVPKDHYRTEYFLSCIEILKGIQDEKELRRYARKLRKDLL